MPYVALGILGGILFISAVIGAVTVGMAAGGRYQGEGDGFGVGMDHHGEDARAWRDGGGFTPSGGTSHGTEVER